MVSWETSLSLGTWLGIPVRVHVLFPLALLSVLVDIKHSWQYVLCVTLLYGPILLATVLIHELGHCLAAKATGSRAHAILLWPLGGMAYVGHSIGPKEDLIVALAGPLTHVAQGGFWLLILLPFWYQLTGNVHLMHLLLYLPPPETSFWMALFAGAVELNMYLLLFNLFLPAYPLDGGRILVDVLLLFGVSDIAAALTTVAAGCAVGFGLCIWSFHATHLMAALVGGWVLFATLDLFKSVKSGTLDEHPLFLFDTEPNMPLYMYQTLYDDERRQ